MGAEEEEVKEVKCDFIRLQQTNKQSGKTTMKKTFNLLYVYLAVFGIRILFCICLQQPKKQ